MVSKEAFQALKQEHAVISTRLLGGRTVVHVYSETPPGAGFEVADPDLKDVYFSTMAGCQTMSMKAYKEIKG